MEWLPIEKKPPLRTYVLCLVEDRCEAKLHKAIFGDDAPVNQRYMIGRRRPGDKAGKMREINNGRLWDCTYWMPLPAAPEDHV